MQVGVHVSIASGIDKAIDRSLEIGCNTFQIFTRNPRGWKYGDLRDNDVKNFQSKLKSSDLSTPLIHMPYLPNIASPVDETYGKSVEALTAELIRSSILTIPYVVTHVGSHLGSGKPRGMKRVISACNNALEKSPSNTMILLENTAGTKNSVGSTFEDLKAIINNIEQKDRVGICLDTCHAFAAGYDLRTKQDVNITMQLFDDVLGINLLKAIHLNDSKGNLGEGLDRHEHIGMGYIGEKGFKSIFKDSRIRDMPMILETPIDIRGDQKGDLKKVRELAD